MMAPLAQRSGWRRGTMVAMLRNETLRRRRRRAAAIAVLSIALDVGFGSIGPFNRAFKAETGLTPTEFRQKALAES